MSSSLIRPIGAGEASRRSWRVFLNGQLIDDVRLIAIEHPRIGTLTYGWTPSGYDGWSFAEHGGGGSVIVPFAFRDGLLLVGVVEEDRPNQGGAVLNAPRGFLDPGEERLAGAVRELTEEMGLRGKVLPIPGGGGNPNSTFFETARPNEGVYFFAVEVSPSDLRDRDGRIAFERTESAPLEEAIGGAWFVPWYEAAVLGDLFTNAAVARLLSYLRGAGRFPTP